MFMERLSLCPNGTHVPTRHYLSRQSPRQTKKTVDCARLLLGSSLSNKRHSSLVGSWIHVVPHSEEYDSDLSDSESENEECDEVLLRETRWSSTPQLTIALKLKRSSKSLTSTLSGDTAMTLPTRKTSFGDLHNTKH
jgi:hypothetical protein